MNEQNKKENLRVCACRNLRMTSRVITQYYDKAFQSVGLKATQFSLLADISSRENSSVGELAESLLMDQTTVTRNIEILRKNGLIDVKIDDEDSRKRCVTITEHGKAKFLEAIPFWENAQHHIEENIGKERYKEFLNTLVEIQNII